MAVVSGKVCVACGKLIAQSFATCSFCKAEQPAHAAAVPQKEKRCETCRRPYAAKLDECPFCARAKIGGGGALAPPSSSSSGSLSSSSAAAQSSGRLPSSVSSRMAEEDDESNRVVSSLLFFGIPLALGATWGIAQSVMGNRLGEASVFGPSIAIGIVVAPILGVLFIRRVVGNLGDAVEDAGLPKLAGYIAGAATIMLLPTALTIMGLVLWFNGLAVSEREQDVICKAGSITHNMRKGVDSGWSVSYICEIEGQPHVGTVDRIMTKPELEENAPIKFRAIKGRAGIWLRVSDPLPLTAITTPPSSR